MKVTVESIGCAFCPGGSRRHLFGISLAREHTTIGSSSSHDRFPPGNIHYEQWHRNKFTSHRDGAIPEINPKIVQEQLGHSSINLTLNTYSHVIKSMRGIAANALEEVVGAD